MPLSGHPASGLSAAGAGDESRDEVLSHTERTRVLRRRLDAPTGSVILKQPLGTDALRRLRHETATLERLSAVDGVVKLAPGAVGAAAVALRDDGGVPLAHRLAKGPLEVPAVLGLARALARVVAAVHRAGVVHKDINPANILLVGAAQTPVLIDFDLAGSLADERPAFTHTSEIAGTLAYLAPEQTGRTGRALDHRADLYALGATLYEATTGRPPFDSRDALDLVRDHLVRIPVPPVERMPHLPRALSDILMRLLEKEPDRRYQSAEGLLADLDRLHERLAAGDDHPFALGAHDFALLLAPPSRLIGREDELAALREALDRALGPRPQSVLVSGAPGVGKTALANELRAMATERQGWFVAGRFDAQQRNPQSAPIQALRMLGHLLLAEPEATLAPLRARLLRDLGANAGLTVQFLPEFGTLLGVAATPAAGDPVQIEQRMLQASLDLLGAVVSPRRPLVMLLDDLQWAGELTLRMVDALFGESAIPGLLLVCTYQNAQRDEPQDERHGDAHPLRDRLARWTQLEVPPRELRLHNLPPAALRSLVAGMLRLGDNEAARLAQVIGERTEGNPFDTVELLNALRRDGVLVPGSDGWAWDEGAIRRFVGQGHVVDLLAVRIERLPPHTAEVLRLIACLGGDVGLGLLEAASGLGGEALRARLEPAIEDGLLTFSPGDGGDGEGRAAFRHGRVREAACGPAGAPGQQAQHLAVARRLAGQPGFATAAATQYLLTADSVVDAGERLAVARLFRGAAAHARAGALYAGEARYLAAALDLLEALPAPAADAHLCADLHIAHHAARYSLGQLDAADAAFAWVQQHVDDAVRLVEPTCVQINSLTSRSRQREAQELGFALLERLGLPVPREGFDTEKRRMVQALFAWIAGDERQHDLQRPEVTDPRVLGAAKLLHYSMGPTFYCADPRGALLVLYSHQLWVAHGPCAPLLTGFGGMPLVTLALKDYRAGWAAIRHALAVGEARGYEPETSWVRHCAALFVQHWFEPLEASLPQAQRAREGLLRGGDLQYACFTYHTELTARLDCAPTLDDTAAVVDAAGAFAARTGNGFFEQVLVQYRALLHALRDDPAEALPESAAPVPQPGVSDVNPTAVVSHHLIRALAGAIFGDPAALQRHAAAAVPLLPYVAGYYVMAQVRFLHGLALAQQAQHAPADAREPLLSALDACRDWLAQRADDASANFRHLVTWLQAERAWATGETLEAMRRFDAALGETPPQRPWHRALLTERAALFHLASGLDRGGRNLLAEARRLYAAWGATAKVRQMDRTHPALRTGAGTAAEPRPRDGTTRVSADLLDMVAILRASQALSSETSLARLETRVGELLGAMTGADTVRLALNGDGGWFVSRAGADGQQLSVDEAGARGLLPLSAFRYAERTGRPLLVEDAVRDDRFARDPHVVGAERCSLLVVPILNHGEMRAMLLFENRQSRAAFSADRLDAVMLIAGQLAVSLDNALLYDSLERKVAERTAALEAANRQLAELSVTDTLTGLANRRRFDETLQYEWLRALRTKGSIGLAMIDVDQFKAYNDHYGHVRGDHALKRVAQALRDEMRRGELVARYGGEEFVVVLAGADLAGAHAAAERLRAAVAALAEPHAASPHGVVTVSIGVVAFVPDETRSVAQYLAQADAALYEGKRLGRNRVCGAASDESSPGA